MKYELYGDGDLYNLYIHRVRVSGGDVSVFHIITRSSAPNGGGGTNLYFSSASGNYLFHIIGKPRIPYFCKQWAIYHAYHNEKKTDL